MFILEFGLLNDIIDASFLVMEPVLKLDKTKPYIFSLESVLSELECSEMIDFIESANPKPAPINTVFGEKIKPDVRNNERVMRSDLDLANAIYGRVKKGLPSNFFDYKICGLNELFRCYKYKPGMRFTPHSDGAYERNEYERSFYTFLIYLNAVDKGGETAFAVEPAVTFKPKAGLGLLFQHPIVHEGCEVQEGLKYVVRTDVMYSRC